MAGEAAATPEAQFNGEVRAEETPDLPVTMAAATDESVAEASAASRWTAVPVALEGDEATVSLEQEMQKAYAAYAAYMAAEADASSVATVRVAEKPALADSSSVDVVPVVETTPVENSSALRGCGS